MTHHTIKLLLFLLLFFIALIAVLMVVVGENRDNYLANRKKRLTTKTPLSSKLTYA